MQSPGRNTDNKTKKLASMGLFLTLALILSYVETLIPFNFGIPGIKLGLANLCTLIVLYLWGIKEAFLINCLRIIVSGFMFGNISMIIYSLAGAILSMLVMYLLMKPDRFSIMGISLSGGVFHNIGQCIVACLIVSDYRVAVYLPVLLVAGALTGILIGFISGLVLPRIKRLVI